MNESNQQLALLFEAEVEAEVDEVQSIRPISNQKPPLPVEDEQIGLNSTT